MDRVNIWGTVGRFLVGVLQFDLQRVIHTNFVLDNQSLREGPIRPAIIKGERSPGSASCIRADGLLLLLKRSYDKFSRNFRREDYTRLNFFELLSHLGAYFAHTGSWVFFGVPFHMLQVIVR